MYGLGPLIKFRIKFTIEETILRETRDGSLLEREAKKT